MSEWSVAQWALPEHHLNSDDEKWVVWLDPRTHPSKSQHSPRSCLIWLTVPTGYAPARCYLVSAQPASLTALADLDPDKLVESSHRSEIIYSRAFCKALSLQHHQTFLLPIYATVSVFTYIPWPILLLRLFCSDFNWMQITVVGLSCLKLFAVLCFYTFGNQYSIYSKNVLLQIAYFEEAWFYECLYLDICYKFSFQMSAPFNFIKQIN